MRIINAVFSKQNGGLEQASLDYAEALALKGHDITFLLRDHCPFETQARAIGLLVHVQPNRFGKRDAWAVWQLRRYLQAEQPDAIFAHGNRAIVLLQKAAHGICPVIAVNHTTSVKPSLAADAAIVVNHYQKQELEADGAASNRVFVVPNMVRIEAEHRTATIPKTLQTPPVIGTLARLSPEKGVGMLLRALTKLKTRGVAFRCVIGGHGPLEAELKKQAKKWGLERQVDFIGWVEDRTTFYRNVDVVCVPSHAETFGIVMLEALLHKRPVVSTHTHGARQLAGGYDIAQFVPPGDAAALADGLQYTLENWPKAKARTQAGFDLAVEKYDIQTVAGYLQQVLDQVTK